jgi:hypothetical protein
MGESASRVKKNNERIVSGQAAGKSNHPQSWHLLESMTMLSRHTDRLRWLSGYRWQQRNRSADEGGAGHTPAQAGWGRMSRPIFRLKLNQDQR